MSALFRGRRILSLIKSVVKLPIRKEAGYYVVLPEIGDDLPDKYPLLKEETKLPEFNHITIENCIATIAKQSLEVEEEVALLAKEIENKSKLGDVNVFADIFDNIEKLETPLQLTWGIAKILFYGNETSMPTNYYLSINKRVRIALNHKYHHRCIYNECLKALKDTSDMTEEEKQVLNKYVLEFNVNGGNIKKKDQGVFENYLRIIELRKRDFKNNIIRELKSFKHQISDSNCMQEFPVDYLKTVADDPSRYNEGPWTITLHQNIVKTFLEYCSDSVQRWNIWNADVSMCSTGQAEKQNSAAVNDITADKIAWAKSLGYKNFVEMNLSTKMVGSEENLQHFMDAIFEKAYPLQVEEISDLNNFANEHGFEGKLNQWDLPYWIRRYKEHLYNYDEEVLRKYFSLSRVVNYTFNLVKQLFNLEIVERKNVCTWNRNVLFFDVFDLERSSTEHVGSFYFDPIGYSYMTQIYSSINELVIMSNRSDICHLKPLCSFILKLKPPDNDSNTVLMNFSQVKTFVGKVGRMLQHVLTKTKRSDISGTSFMEWDAINISEQVLSKWVYHTHFLKNVTRHCETGEPLDDKMIRNIIESQNHMIGYFLCRELYLCNFDLDLYSVHRHWNVIMKRQWRKHFVLPIRKEDSHVCSWTDVILEQPGASYYSDLWSKMVAADIYSAFVEAGENVELERKAYQRYKDTYLSLSSSVSAGEVFRRFRGRDPDYTPFMKNANLLRNDKEVKYIEPKRFDFKNLFGLLK